MAARESCSASLETVFNHEAGHPSLLIVGTFTIHHFVSLFRKLNGWSLCHFIQLRPGWLSDSLSDLQLADFAEMMAIDRKCYIQREHSRSAKKSPEHDLPILESLFSENAQADTRTPDCQ